MLWSILEEQYCLQACYLGWKLDQIGAGCGAVLRWTVVIALFLLGHYQQQINRITTQTRAQARVGESAKKKRTPRQTAKWCRKCLRLQSCVVSENREESLGQRGERGADELKFARKGERSRVDDVGYEMHVMSFCRTWLMKTLDLAQLERSTTI